MKHILMSNICPTCGQLIHKTKPELNLIADKTLQQIVYRLVPGLLEGELKRRKTFYLSKTSTGNGTEDNLSLSDYSMSNETDHTKICVVVDILKAERQENRKRTFVTKSKKYLFCPGLFTIKLLKKFIRGKCEMEDDETVEVLHAQDTSFLPDHYTLLDVAEVFNWRAESPLELKCITVTDDDSSATCDAETTDDKQSKSVTPECPFQTFKEFCNHLRKSSKKFCPLINQRKRHKKNKNKNILNDVTNTIKHSHPTHEKISNNDLKNSDPSEDTTCSHNLGCNEFYPSTYETTTLNHQSCKVKLRIRAKGIEDSVLILPSSSNSSHDMSSSTSDLSQNQNAHETSVTHILKSHNMSHGKFMSKKSMFFSRLNQENVTCTLPAENVKTSEHDVGNKDTLLSTLEDTSSSPFALREDKTNELPNVITEKPMSVRSSDDINTKERPSLTTHPTRKKCQLWTPYKSPGKDDGRGTSQQVTSTTVLSLGSVRSKSPVIVFNPSLPLPSFTSLLQSFNSASSSIEVDQPHDVDSSEYNNKSFNSKIGIFISKGKSMTLEQKTKLEHDEVVTDKDVFGNLDDPGDVSRDGIDLKKSVLDKLLESPINPQSPASIEVLPPSNEKVGGVKNTSKRSYKPRHFPTSQKRTPPWLGKRIQIKKSFVSKEKSINDLKSTSVDGDLNSPHRKKQLLENGVDRNENLSEMKTPSKFGKGDMTSRTCNLSKRALKIIN